AGARRCDRPVVDPHRRPEVVHTRRREDREGERGRHPARGEDLHETRSRDDRGVAPEEIGTMRGWLSALVVITACGPKPPPSVNPVLPGDGDKNTAKPTNPAKPKADDPWTGKELIAMPAARPVTAVELPPIEEAKLSNGLQVFLIKRNGMPTVSVQLAIKAGRSAEPHSRLGVAEITADMMVKGTRRRDAAALAKAIDAVGGTIAADSTFEAT